MKNKLIKYIDYLLAFLVVCDLAFMDLVAYIGLPSLSDYFEGRVLIGITTQIFLFFGLGIAVVITFFLHHRTAKWFLLAYVAVIFLASQISWTPNTEFTDPEFSKIFKNMAIVLSSVKIYTYPNWLKIILYLFGLSYAFIIRSLYNKPLERDAK